MAMGFRETFEFMFLVYYHLEIPIFLSQTHMQKKLYHTNPHAVNYFVDFK